MLCLNYEICNMLSILNKLTLPTLIIGYRFCIMLGILNKLTWLKQLQNFVTSKGNLQHGRQTYSREIFHRIEEQAYKALVLPRFR